ncbi:MAG: hypothetical protein U0236_23695 [Nitrospira sp.]
MDAAQEARLKRKKELLVELAELTIEEQVAAGVFLGTPHYSVIERAAVHLGRELSRQAQERGAREVAANCNAEVPCPTCQTVCSVEVKTREIKSTDGLVQLPESVAHCPQCRRSFFPSTRSDGIG